MIRVLLIALLLPVAVRAQLTLTIIDESVETPLPAGSEYRLRTAEIGEPLAPRLRVRNAGSAAVDVTQFVAIGPGFILERPLPPYRLQAGEILNGTLRFTGTESGEFRATVHLNGLSVTIVATVVPGLKLTPQSPCFVSTTTGAIDFGMPTLGQTATCGMLLENQNTVAVEVTKLAVSGAGFSIQSGGAVPVTVGAGTTFSFTMQFSPGAAGRLNGTLQVNARPYPLTGLGVNPPIVQPIIEYGSGAITSGQQRTITMRLQTASPITVSGDMTLSFEPSSTLAADDPGIVFLENNSRTVRFAIAQGQTAVTLHGRNSVTMQTGTTAGRIRIGLSSIPVEIQGDPTVTLNVPPANVAFDKTIATRFLDRIELVITGFDNTFSAGSMLFRFYDASGQPVVSAISANFVDAFRNYYTDHPGGSTFLVTLRFPLSGDVSKIASMEAEFTNTSGTIRTSRLTF